MGSTSVIIPCHNYGAYLSWCINSVLHQSSRPEQIIVVDDGSTDCTSLVAKSFGSNINYYKVDFCNAQITRNFGLSKATGKYVLFLDADDFLDNDCLKVLEAAMNEDPGLKLAYSDRYQFGNPAILKKLGFEYLAQFEEFSIETLRDHNIIPMPSLIRRACFGGFDERIERFQDWDAWLSCLTVDSDAKRIPRPLHHARFHGANKTVLKNLFIERLKVLVKHGLFNQLENFTVDTDQPVQTVSNIVIIAYNLTSHGKHVLLEFAKINRSAIRIIWIVSPGSACLDTLETDLTAIGVSYHINNDKTVDLFLQETIKKDRHLETAGALFVSDFNYKNGFPIDASWLVSSKPLIWTENPALDLLALKDFEGSGTLALNRAALIRLFFIAIPKKMRRSAANTERSLLRRFFDRHLLWRFNRK